uniref:Uncharacterized protein n=1 Tax=Arundo donax TaxID=35708 RepID=A0A0A8YQW6_ARUDO
MQFFVIIAAPFLHWRSLFLIIKVY